MKKAFVADCIALPFIALMCLYVITMWDKAREVNLCFVAAREEKKEKREMKSRSLPSSPRKTTADLVSEVRAHPLYPSTGTPLLPSHTSQKENNNTQKHNTKGKGISRD